VKEFTPIDDETGINEYPGYVGMTWDGELSVLSKFNSFKNFEWDAYSELVEEFGEKRELIFKLREQDYYLEFEAYQDVALLINELHSLEVHYDDGAQYGGMCSGRGYIFFLKENYTHTDVTQELEVLKIALEQDLALLRAKN
jgi:hypothetical protein